MRPSRILRSISLKLLRSPIVVPLPIQTLFSQKFSKETEALQTRGAYLSTNWLLDALDASIVTQKIAEEALPNVICKESNREAIDGCLDDNIVLLDTCNNLLEKIEIIYKYVESLRLVLRMLNHGRFEEPNPIGLKRAKQVLDMCQRVEKRQFREMSKCDSSLRRLNHKLAQMMASHIARDMGCSESELDEILNGSVFLVSIVCDVLSMALSFKSKKGVSVMRAKPRSSWSCSLFEIQKKMKEETRKHKKGSKIVLHELQRAMETSQLLREQIKSQNHNEMRKNVEELKRSCDELDEGLKPFEDKVKFLYRQLMSFRMALLRTLSSL